MKHFFLQFNLISPNRLVWKGGETPTATPPKAPETATPPVDSEAAAKKQAELAADAAKARAAREAADQEAINAGTQVLATLGLIPPPEGETPQGGGGTTTGGSPEIKEAPPTNEAITKFFQRNLQKFIDAIQPMNADLEGFLKDFDTKYANNPNQFIEDFKQILVNADKKFIEIEATLSPEDQKILRWFYQQPVLDLLKGAVELDKYLFVDGKINTEVLKQKLLKGELKENEYGIAMVMVLMDSFASVLEKAKIDPKTLDNFEKALIGARTAVARSKEKAAQEFTLAEVNKALGKYPDAYLKFLQDGESGKDEYLKAIPDITDKAKIKYAIEAPVTLVEKKSAGEMLKARNISMPTNIDQIIDLVMHNTISYREGKICKAILDDAKKAAEGGPAAAAKAVEAGGFMELLEKLIDKLTELANRIGLQLDKFFKPKEAAAPKLDKSPIQLAAGQKLNVLAEHSATHPGIDLKGTPNTDVVAGTSGKVVKVEGDQVRVQKGNGFLVYKGLKPAVAEGATVTADTKLGTLTTGTLNFQVLDDKNSPIDPRSFVADFVQPKPEEKAAEAPAVVKDFEIKGSPVPLKPDGTLAVAKTFTETGNKGVVLTAAEGTAISSMGPGFTAERKGDDALVLTYKDKKVTISGLAKDSRLSPDPAKVYTENTTVLGKAGKDNVTITIESDGKPVDPATIFGAYLQKPAEKPSAPAVKPPPVPTKVAEIPAPTSAQAQTSTVAQTPAPKKSL